MKKLFDCIIDKLSPILPKSIMNFLKRFLSVEFFVFVCVGVINTFNTAIVATIFDRMIIGLNTSAPTFYEIILRFRLTFVFAYIVSLVISFFLNTYLTFREKPTFKKFATFPISYIPNFCIQYICVRLFAWLSWNSTIGYITSAIIGIPITFLTMRWLVFRKK